jgi:8-oxo-dGTP diphosphatase
MNNGSNNKKRRNPIPTVDMIIHEKPSSILLIRRRKGPFKDYFALPGGFVNEGETVEDAARREAMEELSVKVEPIDILGVYSEPNRDPRGHIMSITFIAKISNEVEARSKDDAAEIKWINFNDIDNVMLAFDHSQILSDYMRWLNNKQTFCSTKYKKK